MPGNALVAVPGQPNQLVQAVLSAHHPSLTERFGNAIYDAAAALGYGGQAQRMRNDAETAAGFVPVLGSVLSADDATRDYSAGNYGSALANLGLAALGVMPGGKLAELPMDEAARMARAAEMGFRTKLPLYHGSGNSFDAFNPAIAGSTSGSAAGKQGVFVALDPQTADEFAQMAAAKQGNAQIYPLLHRTENPAMIDLQGDEMNHEIAATLEDAFSNGHDAVLLKNYTTPGGKTGRNIIVVKDPSQLRSPHAAFDPAKIDSGDILASLIGAGVIAPSVTASVMNGDQNAHQ